jgi:hypothetical protein
VIEQQPQVDEHDRRWIRSLADDEGELALGMNDLFHVVVEADLPVVPMFPPGSLYLRPIGSHEQAALGAVHRRGGTGEEGWINLAFPCDSYPLLLQESVIHHLANFVTD